MAKLVVDMEGVESSGGGRVRVPEGDYRMKLDKVSVTTAKSSGNTMLKWEFSIAQGKHKGKGTFFDYTTLNVEALWKLKKLLEAFGVKVPSSKLDLTPMLKELKGKEVGATVTDDEYEGKISSKITDYIDLDTLEGADSDDDPDEEDEKPKSKKGKKGKKGKKKKEDDDDEIEDLDTDEL